MKITSILVATGAFALASAQYTISANGTITCPIPNGTYCSGPGSNIIIRCSNGVGQGGNCNDNLDGEPPQGLSYAPCFDCGAASGVAACSKNGIVYPGSGSGLGSNPFPSNSTTACQSVSPGGPATYSNGTNPGGPIINATSFPASGLPKPSGNLSTSAGGKPAYTTSPPSAQSTAQAPSGATGAGSSATTSGPSSASGSPASATTNAAASVHIMGAGAAIGFGALYFALGMM